MDFKLISLSGTQFDASVYEVILPTADGEISVFPSHESLVSVAVPGVIRARRKKEDTDESMEIFAISGGMIEVTPEGLRVLVDEADSSDDIVEAEAKSALERAIAMRDNAKNQVELEKAHQLVDRHAVRLKVAGLRRRKNR